MAVGRGRGGVGEEVGAEGGDELGVGFDGRVAADGRAEAHDVAGRSSVSCEHDIAWVR